MAGIMRKVHPVSSFDYGSIDKFAADLGIRQNPDNGGGKPSTPNALAFTDPDGEQHVYVFSEEGRKALIGKLTGGIMVVPGS